MHTIPGFPTLPTLPRITRSGLCLHRARFALANGTRGELLIIAPGAGPALEIALNTLREVPLYLSVRPLAVGPWARPGRRRKGPGPGPGPGSGSPLAPRRAVPPPAAWPARPTYRACELCLHGQEGRQWLCSCPAAPWLNAPQPVAIARAPGGFCGPQARFLDMESWKCAARS